MPSVPDETTRFLQAWMQVRQIVQAANFNRFQRAGLSATQFMTLNVIPPAGMTLSELARKLNLSPATLNATVNSLAERGFLRRTPDPHDARKIILEATPPGQEMQNAATADFHTFISTLFDRMSPTRRNGLLAGLEQMVHLAEGTAKTDSQPEFQVNAQVDIQVDVQAVRQAKLKARPYPRATRPASTPARPGAAPPASRNAPRSRPR